MAHASSLAPREPAALARLSALAALGEPDAKAVVASIGMARLVQTRREVRPGDFGSSLLVSGWAARSRNFADGRRQLLHILLPGDVFDPAEPPGEAVTTIIALTDISVAPAPVPSAPETGLARAYAAGAMIERKLLHRQIARLGRLDAHERLADLLLEFRDRLALARLASDAGFVMPMTQEMLADTLGLTSVHVNRMVRMLRESGAAEIGNGGVRILDSARLEALVDWQPFHRPTGTSSPRSELIG